MIDREAGSVFRRGSLTSAVIIEIGRRKVYLGAGAALPSQGVGIILVHTRRARRNDCRGDKRILRGIRDGLARGCSQVVVDLARMDRDQFLGQRTRSQSGPGTPQIGGESRGEEGGWICGTVVERES